MGNITIIKYIYRNIHRGRGILRVIHVIYIYVYMF